MYWKKLHNIAWDNFFDKTPKNHAVQYAIHHWLDAFKKKIQLCVPSSDIQVNLKTKRTNNKTQQTPSSQILLKILSRNDKEENIISIQCMCRYSDYLFVYSAHVIIRISNKSY